MRGWILVAAVAAVFTTGVGGAAAATSLLSVPAGTLGNEPQSSPGPYCWDLNFDVVSPIDVTSLGAFDSGTDGIFLGPIQVGIFNRDTGTLVTPVLTFTTGDPGTAEGGYRFKNLATQIMLDAGFHGTVAAAGYNGTGWSNYEPFGNPVHPNPPGATFIDSGGLLTNLGYSTYYRPTSTLVYDPAHSIGGVQYGAPNAAPNFQYASHTTAPLPTAAYQFTTVAEAHALNAINASAHVESDGSIHGTMVGMSAGNQQNLLWDSGSVSTFTVAGSEDAQIRGVNDNGQMVGCWYDGNGGWTAYTTDKANFGTITTISEPTANVVSGKMDQMGNIVGYYTLSH